MAGGTVRRRVRRLTLPGDNRPADVADRADLLAAEEPLGIPVDGAAVSMTMRTPGDDIELAAGFLAGEAVVRSPTEIAAMKVCGRASFELVQKAVLAGIPVLAAVSALLARGRTGRGGRTHPGRFPARPVDERLRRRCTDHDRA